jgi:hypothetical protein
MMCIRSMLRGVAVVVGAMLGASCGAGLITGIASSEGGNPTGEVTPPQISPVTPVMPLVPAPNSTRSVVVSNAPIAAAAQIRVLVRALGIGADDQEFDQLNPTATGQGESTVITFTLDTRGIVALLPDATKNDVVAQLRVLVDGEQIATPVGITLARQARAAVVLEPTESQRFVSPAGERVNVRLTGLAPLQADDLQMFVTTRDPETAPTPTNPTPEITRLCTALALEPLLGPDVISAFVPGSTIPVQASIVVIDETAGLSQPAIAYYRPEIALALPSQGTTTGGSVLTLIGEALAPLDFGAGIAPAPFAWDDLTLSFAKGERIIELPREDLRTPESGRDRLVFTMPPSPDGRPGQVDIVLRVRLGAVTAQFVASQVFLFANPDPFFGPRGAVLDRLPVAVASIALDRAPNTEAAPDIAALTDQGGVAFLQLLLSQQNGMYQAFAAPRQVGDHEVVEERLPRDLGVGDFNGDGVPDVFVVNAGATNAVHHLVLGQARPLPPLGGVFRVPTAGGMTRCRVARFDAEPRPDLLLVPGPGAAPAQRPVVVLALPPVANEPRFAVPFELDVRDFPYEAIEVADLDGDGNLDVAVASGTQGKLDVAYGDGLGGFGPGVALDFTVPNYAFATTSPAVGLHACGDATQQSLALVLAGLPTGAPTQPTVTMMRGSAPRTYAAPAVADTYLYLPFLPSDTIGKSLVTDLDGTPGIEMVVAMTGEPVLVSLGLLQLGASGFQPISGGIEGGIIVGAESPRQIRSLLFDRAFSQATVGAPNAVFVVHEVEIDGGRERRLSTRLVDTSIAGQPRLLPPDAGRQLLPPRAVASGRFYARSLAAGATGTLRDLVVVSAEVPGQVDAISLIENRGFGGNPEVTDGMDHTGLLPASIVRLPSADASADRVVFCDRQSRLGLWRNLGTGAAQAPTVLTAELRTLLPAPLSTTDLADTTRVCLDDVDGDGRDDLVVLLSFALPNPTEGDAALVLLRGIATSGPNEFPFAMPTAATPVHGKARAIELGDFTRGLAGQVRRLELAVAVPESSAGADGDHVRFLRYQPGAAVGDDRFVPGAAPGGPQVLLAGSNPTQLAAADFDQDGSIDLLVACRGDEKLRLFRNSAPATATGGAVQIGAFTLSAGSPWELEPGVPTLLRLSDVNGDDRLDAVVFTQSGSSASLESAVAVYLSTGPGSFVKQDRVSPTRVGSFGVALTGALADWNDDGLPDLLLGWNAPAGINLRILFGGTR